MQLGTGDGRRGFCVACGGASIGVCAWSSGARCPHGAVPGAGLQGVWACLRDLEPHRAPGLALHGDGACRHLVAMTQVAALQADEVTPINWKGVKAALWSQRVARRKSRSLQGQADETGGRVRGAWAARTPATSRHSRRAPPRDHCEAFGLRQLRAGVRADRHRRPCKAVDASRIRRRARGVPGSLRRPGRRVAGVRRLDRRQRRAGRVGALRAPLGRAWVHAWALLVFAGSMSGSSS